MANFDLALANKLELTAAEIKLFRNLYSPIKIQDYLQTLPFNFEKKGETVMSPRRVLRARKCHCLEGALLAALALWLHGHPPLLINMRAKKPDFEHLVVLFKIKGLWGAISKTNHPVLRYRDPIYKNIRELMMSYFHEFFMKNGEKTLTGYSNPLDLRKLKSLKWATSEVNLWEIDQMLDKIKGQSYLPKNKKIKLRLVDKVERLVSNHVEWRE